MRRRTRRWEDQGQHAPHEHPSSQQGASPAPYAPVPRLASSHSSAYPPDCTVSPLPRRDGHLAPPHPHAPHAPQPPPSPARPHRLPPHDPTAHTRQQRRSRNGNSHRQHSCCPRSPCRSSVGCRRSRGRFQPRQPAAELYVLQHQRLVACQENVAVERHTLAKGTASSQRASLSPAQNDARPGERGMVK